MSSLTRACIIGIIVGCSIYALFVLLSNSSDGESIQHLREGVRASVNAKLEMLHVLPPHLTLVPESTAKAEIPAENAPPQAPAVLSDTAEAPTIESSHVVKATANESPNPSTSTFQLPPSFTELFHAAATPIAHQGDQHAEPALSREEATCRSYLEKYAVIPGVSWGMLTTDMQKKWTQLGCDDLLRKHSETVHNAVEQAKAAAPPAVVPSAKKEKGKKKKGSKDTAAGIVDINQDNKGWCHEIKAKYNVVPMLSWGSLPMNYVETWRSRRCDLVFTTERMSARPLSTCPNLNAAAGSDSDPKKSGGKKSSATEHSNLSDALPLIAVMAATTTRKVTKPSTKNLSLFMYLLPSLIRTLDCGFRYEYVMGYDKGDPFYDSKEGMAEVTAWWKDNVETPMRNNGIRVTLRLVKVNNTIKKPGPVFIEMARAAYKAGAAYFYRINDDTELMVNWARKYVDALNALSVPYGVVGPLCTQGNAKILTHDFTTRLHMEIFEMNYYPPELVDWWMDDWISLVYGKARTFKAKSVPVMHHTGTHGTRYAVDSSNAGRLDALVESGRQKIRHYMLTHNVPESQLKAFDLDVYKAFVHSDIPPAK